MVTSITPRGMTVTEAYRDYRNGKFIVNRRYQRKLVWTVEEKRHLIDSLLKGYPIPLILLAHTKSGNYEIIDGMQRLNAIFSFIENDFSLADGSYFDANEFGTAKQALVAGVFKLGGTILLDAKSCSDITEYQLAVTIFPFEDESNVTDIFGRVNSGGKHLSYQEKRQAGITSPLANIVRKVAIELRGDASDDILKLNDMPSISIDGRSTSTKFGYGINANNTFWVSQGILNTKELRDSVDEQIILDIILTLIFNKPFAASKDALDSAYNPEESLYSEASSAVVTYSESRLFDEVLAVISTIKDILNDAEAPLDTFKSIIYKGKQSNSARSAFYTFFMAVHSFVITESKAPSDKKAIIKSITGLNGRLKTDTKHVTSDGRTTNIEIVRGLIQKYFYESKPSLLNHGAGLLTTFENDLRSSKIESNKFEIKQGLVNLDGKFEFNKKLVSKLSEIACSMANTGKFLGRKPCIYIGIADSDSDANRIRELYETTPINFEGKYVFGVDHEAQKLGITLEDYMRRILDGLKVSGLSEPLLTGLINGFEHFNYKGRTVIRISVPEQKVVSFMNGECYIRQDSNTSKATAVQIAEIAARFL